MFSLFEPGTNCSCIGSIDSRVSSTIFLLSIKSLKYASICGAYFWIIGVIFELLIKSVVFKLEGSNKNIANKTIRPLINPNRTPKNLSKPDAPDHLISLLINFITIPPTKIKITKTKIYEIILEISSLPINSLIFGVAKNSRLIAAINAAIHKNKDKNSLVKPLVNEIIPEAIKTTKINQSAGFNSKATP